MGKREGRLKMERSEGAEGREEIPARRLCGGHAKTGPARQLAIGDYLQRSLNSCSECFYYGVLGQYGITEYGFTWLLTCETVVFYSEKALDYQKFSLNLQHFVLVIDRHGCSWIRGYIRGSVPDSAEIYRTGLGLYSQQRAALQRTYLCFNQDWPQTPFAISIAMSLN